MNAPFIKEKIVEVRQNLGHDYDDISDEMIATFLEYFSVYRTIQRIRLLREGA